MIRDIFNFKHSRDLNYLELRDLTLENHESTATRYKLWPGAKFKFTQPRNPPAPPD